MVCLINLKEEQITSSSILGESVCILLEVFFSCEMFLCFSLLLLDIFLETQGEI